MFKYLFLILYCFYQIQVQAFPSANLIANKHTITESDSVTLHCQTPSSIAVDQCYFYTDRGQTPKIFPCLQTLTGTDLLSMSRQRPPANVEVKCFYTVKYEDTRYPSPHSDSVSIAVHSQKPQMSCSDFGDHVVFSCTLPESVEHGTKCNLYIGEADHPVSTTTIMKKTTSRIQQLCQFYIMRDVLLKLIQLVQLKEASCDYSLEHEPNFASARSDGCSLTGKSEKTSIYILNDLTVFNLT
ncbi:uncharacterized protein LOC129604118 [Betta splendens]|uniref:Uncharacterized protein LOC129604118 n=1 Tax=Betta splendens TaxID=158456 RepID=A0A9W2XTE4_BETSP|nr:uncharacterized protein LOC129604118 [Betta splendens]